MQTSPNEPLVTFNHRYEVIHKVVFGLSPSQQDNRTVIVEYAKKLPQNTRDKLLRKIAKENSYIKTLDDTLKQAIETNRETSFVEAASGRYNDQNCMKIETQINELNDSFQDCDINAMNTRITNRSGDGSFNGPSIDPQAETAHLTPQIISDQITENNSYPSRNDSYNRQGYQTNTNTTETNPKHKSSSNSQTRT